MRSNKLSLELTGLLAIVVVTLFLTVTPAVAQQEKVLHSFDENGKDGNYPIAGLTLDAIGNLYGTTYQGGANGGGAVFELSPHASGSWTEKVLHSFNVNGTDGQGPFASLIFDAAGNLYGTTAYGGSGACSNQSVLGCGTVFELKPKASGGWTEKVLHSFNLDATDGQTPYTSLILDAAGNLYGTTYSGGVYGYGTVFELSPHASGGWTEKVLHSFNANGADGAYPHAGLIFDVAGNLYGTTSSGGSAECSDTPPGCGTVFELKPKASGGWTEKALYSFNGEEELGPQPSALIFDTAGNLYGTTFYGGVSNDGAVFEFTPAEGGAWTENVLFSFNVLAGDTPSGLIFAPAAGNLYGTTSGGDPYYGAVFELTVTAGGVWSETILHGFGRGADGREPLASLIFDTAGNLYGTTLVGGTHGYGTVFEIKP